MPVQPISPERLAELLADRIAALPVDDGRRIRVALDGADAARPGELADALVEPLRLRGRPVQRVSAVDFLQAASIRLEYGHQDADAFHDLWLDERTLLREVLDPLEPGGSGRVLPTFRDPRHRPLHPGRVRHPAAGRGAAAGRAATARRWLPFDLTVHLALTPAALARRTAPGQHWTLPAFARYAEETDPAGLADLTVRCDDPRHPALVTGPQG
ncbi:hypothetical protein GCM10020229_29010 [Kitasatospora albolonga]